jgi:rhamnopyranosyl-N-acetylglucosaminyl-diphospho-decaprenol beta-1,3/1,4-galactofuranosyltransferase
MSASADAGIIPILTEGRVGEKIRGMDKLAIVIVTYKRQKLLRGLFDSILKSTKAPWRIVITDNENSDETRSIVSHFSQQVDDQWGQTDPDRDAGTHRVVYQKMERNEGGSGGFAAGVATAYRLGAQWFWIMDDDVAILSQGIERLDKWVKRGHQVIQGQRYNYDGTPFYWQYHFIIPLGIPDPIAPSGFGPAGYKVMDTACFEGGLFSRKVVSQIGLPDRRFFIYWDDTVYGYLASKVTNPIIVPDFVMRRTREINHWDIAGVRKLNSTSDMNRYHIMRNRGFMARYFMVHGDYRPMCFGFGTFLTFCKEVIRIVMVDHSFSTGLRALISGWWASRKILHDPNWKPMPPLAD